MKNHLSVLLVLAVFVSIFTGCKKDDPEDSGQTEEEVITTLNYILTDNSGNTVTMTFQDLDGDGGNNPTITGGVLVANTTYTGALTLLNESETPAENITSEIEEEDEDHQFFFQSNVNGVSISYNDMDSNDNPIGLSSTLTTGNVATGNLTIILRHEPNKSASGVSNGDITNAGGESDIEVTFSVDVQ